MARNTMYVFLMEGTGTGTLTYSKVVDIKDFPDMGGSVEALDKTTLTNWARTYIEGIEETDSTLPFTSNYTLADYQTLKALEGSERHFALWIGGTKSGDTVTPTGVDGKFIFDGYIHTHLLGKGVNEVMEMQSDIIPSTEITLDV